jgi:hypothetical protein
MTKKVKEMKPERYPLERMGKSEQASDSIINEIEEDDEFDPEDFEGPETLADIQNAVRLDMFDAYQHFLYYFEQPTLEKEKPWGESMTKHLIEKLAWYRRLQNSINCNSPGVLTTWIQNMTLHNQETLIRYILKHHGSVQGKTKWGRQL